MERFDEVAAGVRALRVTLSKGNITLRVTQGSAWSIDYDDARKGDALEVERDGDTLRVRQRRGGDLDLRLTAPPELENIDLRVGAGRVEVEGAHGHIHLDSGSGAVALRGAGGAATLKTGNGDVDVDGFDGELTAASGNGRVCVAGLGGQATLRTANGRVEVRDSNGSVEAHNGNGDVALARVGGKSELHTAHGAIVVESPRDLATRATTAMGAIRVVDGAVRDLRLKSHVGEVRCSAALAAGRHELETSMGAIVLELPANIAARVDAQTAFGAVHSDFPLVRVGRSGPMGFGGVRMVGSIGAADPAIDISLRSSKGSLTLRSRSGAPPRPPIVERPPTPPVQPRQPEQGTTLQVLEALARGEITPAEAEDLLSQRV